MVPQQSVLRQPEELVLAAKAVLGWYGIKILTVFPYSFYWTHDLFMIEKAGRVIVQQNLHEEVVSYLEATDYEWFERKLQELRNIALKPLSR